MVDSLKEYTGSRNATPNGFYKPCGYQPKVVREGDKETVFLACLLVFGHDGEHEHDTMTFTRP